jgi:quercetin dioxygenase-like cupin family protein
VNSARGHVILSKVNRLVRSQCLWKFTQQVRKLVHPVLLSAVLCAGSAAYGQQAKDLVSCKPLAQKTGETGCWILASQPLGVLHNPVYWTIDVFPTRAMAEQAKGPDGTVVESLGKIWLLTAGRQQREPSPGTRVTQIGPLEIEEGRTYTAQYMEATLLPGMVSKTHLHSGIEAFYTLTGETCLETPSGTQTGRSGVDIIVPEGVPMELTAVGTEPRRGLILILHDASKPPTTLVDSWHSKHLCDSAK